MDHQCAAVWEKALPIIQEDLSDTSFKTYIAPLIPVVIKGDKLYLEVPFAGYRDTIENRFVTPIKNALMMSYHEELTPVFVLEGEAPTRDHLAGQDYAQTQLNPKYTFDGFVRGKSNQLAHAAAVGCAKNPGTKFNPLFIHGGSGLGKTHLMHAIGNDIFENIPGAKVLYVTAERFTNDFISSLQTNKDVEFRNKYRGVDALLVDDIQFFADKGRTLEEFFHTFNALHEADKQIVITSDKSPNEISSFDVRFRSRFQWGLTADIAPPDYETRIAILLKKAETEGYVIDDPDVVPYIASKIQSNIRELEGSLNRVVTYAHLTGQNISKELTEEALKDVFSSTHKKAITPNVIMQAVCDYYDITVEDIKSHRRSRDVTWPRHVAMYLIRQYANVPLTRIGELFGDRDHTTVMNACDKVANSIKKDPYAGDAVEDIIQRITE